jgi:predicted metal-dependent enzyme (double-stranded beta helix superfamily)
LEKPLSLSPLRDFVIAATRLVSQDTEAPALLAAMATPLAGLVASDDWRPAALAQPHPDLSRPLFNGLADRVSISRPVHGANIGAVQRAIFAEDGSRTPLISGHANAWGPHLWPRAKTLRPGLA